jgi:hypothetical protein
MVARNMKHGLMTRRPAERARCAQSHARRRRMRWDVTRRQVTAVAPLTSLTLICSIVLPAQKADVAVGAKGSAAVRHRALAASAAPALPLERSNSDLAT